MQICPSCGEENPARFRLCGHCGSLLVATPASQEMRKTVTIVFTDLQGSTSLGEALDAEALREVMGRYFDEMRVILEAHGGRVEKFIGDAIMAVFGLPRLHEDDALRAVRAAAGMQQSLRQLNVELDERWGVQLANRTGVNTGEVVAGDPASGQRLVTGDAVNVASRLEQSAPESEVLIGEATYRLVRDAVEVEEITALLVKGKAERVGAYRLIAVRDTEGFARHLDAPMVGRGAELNAVLAAFGAAVGERRPRLVSILGDAGVGKSRLVSEVIARLGDQAHVLRGRCLSYGEGITFWPLGEVVRQAAAISDDESTEQAYARLATLLPNEPMAVERIAAAIGLTTASFELNDTFWAARRLLEELSRDHPVVVHFEDIHWAEPTFLDLVLQICATVTNAPMLVICSSRRELLDGRPAWGEDIAGALLVALQPLSSADAGRVVDNLLGDSDISSEVRHRITAAAEGHPLYVEQFLSMLVDDGRLRQEDGRWLLELGEHARLEMPPTIAALLTARIDALDYDERAVLERGSVIGLAFYRGAVEELASETMRDQVGPILLRLVSKQLVAPEGEFFENEETYRFQHALIRDAAYHGMLKRARADFHERFVGWLEGVTGTRKLEVEEIIGYHLEQAHRYRSELGPLDRKGRTLGIRAALRLSSAGRRAFARGDMPAASNLMGRAVALLPELTLQRVELMCDLAEALLDLGELTRAEGLAEQAIAGGRQLGDERLITNASLVRLFVRYVTDSEGWTAAALREAERAIPALEEVGDHAGLAKVWRLLGSVHGTACRYADAEHAVQQSIDHARLAGDRRQEIRSLPAYATSALYGPTPVELAIQRCEQILEQAPGDLRAEGIVRCTLAQLHAMAGRFTDARALYRRGREIFTQLGGRLLIASVSLDSGRVELLAGDPLAAIAELRPDHDALEQMGERYLRSTVAGLLARAELEAGLDSEAETHARACRELAAPDDVEAQALWRGTLACLLIRAGDVAAAEPLAREAVALVRRTDGLVMQAGALVDLAEVLMASGQQDEARSAAAEAVDLYERKGHVIGLEASRHALQGTDDLSRAP
ncbi:MAG: ATP-binding protein [Candidatus Limnocylindria bacterium]